MNLALETVIPVEALENRFKKKKKKNSEGKNCHRTGKTAQTENCDGKVIWSWIRGVKMSPEKGSVCVSISFFPSFQGFHAYSMHILSLVAHVCYTSH